MVVRGELGMVELVEPGSVMVDERRVGRGLDRGLPYWATEEVEQ
jgi:hypothetical protein